MKPSVDVRTPISTGDARKVGPGRFRKQVLPVGEFKVGERTLKVTGDYCRQVADAFADRAYDTAPVMLADKTNDHTMALLDEGGEVLALDAEPDGLYATVQLSNEPAERVGRNPRLGVSVRIRENYARSDGKFYPAAMQHLLLTWDPRIAGMKPWEQVDLSNAGDDVVVVDLSNLAYPITDQTEGMTRTEGEPIMAGLTDDEMATLRAALPLLARLEQGGTGEGVDTAPAASFEVSDDDEFAAIAADIFADLDDDDEEGDEGAGTEGVDTEGVDTDDTETSDAGDDTDDDGEDIDAYFRDADIDEPADDRELVSASNADDDWLDVGSTGRSADQDRILELSNKLDAADYKAERDALVKATGIPPSIIDLAQPLLQGSGNVVELSNGTRADAGDIIRKVLTSIGERIQLLDLSAALGTDEPDDEAVQAAERRLSIADEILANVN